MTATKTCGHCKGSGKNPANSGILGGDSCVICGGWGYLPDVDQSDEIPADWSHLAVFCGVVAAIVLVIGFVAWAFSVAGV